MTLTIEQLKRQDFVDNAILDLIEKITGKNKLYDAELIGNIRDAIIQELIAKEVIAADNECEFYPFIITE